MAGSHPEVSRSTGGHTHATVANDRAARDERRAELAKARLEWLHEHAAFHPDPHGAITRQLGTRARRERVRGYWFVQCPSEHAAGVPRQYAFQAYAGGWGEDDSDGAHSGAGAAADRLHERRRLRAEYRLRLGRLRAALKAAGYASAYRRSVIRAFQEHARSEFLPQPYVAPWSDRQSGGIAPRFGATHPRRDTVRQSLSPRSRLNWRPLPVAETRAARVRPIPPVLVQIPAWSSCTTDRAEAARIASQHARLARLESFAATRVCGQHYR